MRALSYLRAGLATTLNVVLNAASLGRYVWLEGAVRGGVFRNWAGRFATGPCASQSLDPSRRSSRS